MLDVNEIFYSIQGESTHAGRPCVFVRLSYCNLRCTFCDTKYAFEKGEILSIDSIIEKIQTFNCKLVEITGGEPLLQESSNDLMKILCRDGYEVLLETNGSVDISRVDPSVKKIVDFKSPSSGMENQNMWENVQYLKAGDEVKFVIADRADYDWAREKINKHGLINSVVILMSPVFGKLEPEKLSEWILHDKLNVRFQLQLHKYIWNPERRGV
ncbi:MAG: 7-carboxy-7-deazaguanine synthase [Chlorobiaceae bacterium]|nr:7-carboxy-7-deazaguanine synthase [Chlorobiaceae bacterium]